MKKLLTLALLAIGATSLTAQTLPSTAKDENARNFKKHVRHMLSLQQQNAKYKTTGLTERVIGESSYTLTVGPTPIMYDSTQYKYSGFNGSKFDFGYMEFNAYFGAGYGALDYPYGWTTIPVMADTVRYWHRASQTGPLELEEMMTAVFNSNKNLTFHGNHYMTAGVPDDLEFYYLNYDAQGNIVLTIGLEDYGTGLDSTIKLTSFYNAQGQRQTDSLFNYDSNNNLWEAEGVISYSYDASGNIASISMDGIDNGTWGPMFKYENAFYPDNKLKTSHYYSFDQTALVLSGKDTLGYTNSSFPTFHAEYYMNNGTWEPARQTIKHLNAQSLPDTVYSYMKDFGSNNWVMSDITAYTYTSYGNPIESRRYSIGGSSMDIWVDNYYYEIYNDPTGLKNIAAQEQMTVYPNPATSEIKVSWSKGAGKKVTLELINAAGQKAYGATFNWKENQSVPLQNLAPGMYFLIVRNEAGAVIFKEAVVKQ